MELGFQTARLVAAPAGRADVEALQACLDGAPDYFERLQGCAAEPDTAERLLDEAEADATRRVLLLRLRAGGAAAGVLDLDLARGGPGTAHVVLLLLREAFQGLGLGAELVRATEQRLRARGLGLVTLAVCDEHPEARDFWERMGYETSARVDRGVTLLEKRLDAAAS
ncbi:MAG TPA: GNAT family N-acetyltransferase [Anaeromyxobacteraceae bacterium]|nr:GNAT family N-acetyltransferase [Anaeromyxobacteraceae bacterium]